MVNLFTGMHDIAGRDKTRNWDESQVKTELFDAKEQPVPSYQNPWELAQLIDIFVKREYMSYLELGPYHGGTLYWFLKHAIKGSKIGAVDFFDEKLGGRWKTPEDWKKDWVRKGIDFKFFGGNTHDPELILSVRNFFSPNYGADGREPALDCLFIDATHDYEDCKADLMNYGPLVRSGGIIAFHDVRPRNMGSCQLWEELRQVGHVTQLLVADPYSETVDAGIGVLYVQ